MKPLAFRRSLQEVPKGPEPPKDRRRKAAVWAAAKVGFSRLSVFVSPEPIAFRRWTFSSMERDIFHVSYLSDKIPEALFHGQVVKTVAYLRVSTAQQDVRSQRLAILEYARKHDFRIDDFIEATASGQASEKRRRLDELMNVLQRSDRLVVSELSRLGRSLGQIVAILDALAKARSSGRKLGRPKGSLGVSRLNGKEDDIRRFLDLGVSKTAIAKLTGVSRTTLYSFMSTRGLKPSP